MLIPYLISFDCGYSYLLHWYVNAKYYQIYKYTIHDGWNFGTQSVAWRKTEWYYTSDSINRQSENKGTRQEYV